MTQVNSSTRGNRQGLLSGRHAMKRKTLLYVGAAGLAGLFVATAPLVGRSGEVAPAADAARQAAAAAEAPEAKVTKLFSKDLKDFPGKEGLMITVEYPPGSVDPVHRHNAHGFIYVLEGSIVMQVKGGKEVTVKPGETFYEGPDDIHTVGRNASTTKPAKFVVFFVNNKDAPILVPEK